MSVNTIVLSATDLGLAALLVLLLALTSWRMRLGLGGQIVIAAIRTTLQLGW
ncbi:ABC transporter permease [Desulfosarcina cetonica]|uniref:ABC transporter permease n=1 Tax=Desulfosarcina cetonica TaxID=90730 RepID=UPI0030EC7CAD